MNEKLRQFEKESKLEIFGLGARRDRWEAALEKYAELIVKECAEICMQEIDTGLLMAPQAPGIAKQIKQHFGIEDPKGWICPKCNADRTKIACPLGFGATVDDRCPMTVEAQ